jgi:branched-chain amino acid transport system substrate-binding protein
MWSLFIVRIAVTLGLAAYAAGHANAQDSVKIGMVMPLTGALAAAGQQVAAGARLYM